MADRLERVDMAEPRRAQADDLPGHVVGESQRWPQPNTYGTLGRHALPRALTHDPAFPLGCAGHDGGQDEAPSQATTRGGA